jgi:hypothetical protein
VTGVGDSPKTFDDYVRVTNKRIVALERQLSREGAILLSGRIVAGAGVNIDGVGTSGDPMVISIAGYTYMGTAIFTSSGTFNRALYPNLRAIRVRVQAAGGAGGGAGATSAAMMSYGAGGGAGGYAESFITDLGLVGASQVVTVGAGGTGVANATGNSGGASSFGTLVAADGGAGGISKPNTALGGYLAGGVGGEGTAGDLQLGGGGGNGGGALGNFGNGGNGGTAILGGGGNTGGTAAGATGGAGSAGKNYGGGGGGAFANSSNPTARVGGTGGPGVVLVELYG